MKLQGARIRLVMDLRRAGLADTAVLSAIERLPRPQFVRPQDQDQAWDDVAMAAAPDWPAVTRPLHAATYLQALRLVGRERVLQVATGSGYLAALLAGSCRWVYTVDADRAARKLADERFRALRIGNVVSRTGDPLAGWSEQAPFDRIAVDGVLSVAPTNLVAQLRDGGSLVVPLGDEKLATIVRIVRTADGSTTEAVLRTSFAVSVRH